MFKAKTLFWLSLISGALFLIPAGQAWAGTEARAPEVRVFSAGGSLEMNIMAYSRLFGGGVAVAAGDILGDDRLEIVSVSGQGGRTHIRGFTNRGVFNGVSIFPFHPNFRGTADLDLGDTDGDGQDEIIVSQASDGDTRIKVYKPSGKIVAEWLAFAPEFKGGVNIAAGDINKDGRDEIVVGAGAGGNPHVRVFDGAGKYLGLDFFPQPADFRGGIDVALGDVDKNGVAEIITSAASMGTANIKVYRPEASKTVIGNFVAFSDDYKDGARVAAGDIDSDGVVEILASRASNSVSEVKSFKYNGQPAKFSKVIYDNDFRGGVNVAAGDLDNDGRTEVITGPRKFIWEGRRDLYKYIDIDLTQQRLRVYENGRQRLEAITSTGHPGMPTPDGQFTVLSKEVRHWSGKYGLWMPYSLKFHSGGFYIHRLPEWPNGYVEGENHLGIRVSHGCVRVGYKEAEILYNMVEVGTPIIIHY